MNTTRITLALLLLLVTGAASAVQYSQCFSSAAKKYQIDRDLLVAIAMWESKVNAKALNANNRDGTKDYGVMQINSRHLPLLKKAGFNVNDLYDPCTNIYIGAFVLKDCIRTNGNKWRAVGAYNAGSTKANEIARKKYVNNIRPIYEKIKTGRVS